MIARKILVLALVAMLPGTSPALARAGALETAPEDSPAGPALRPAAPGSGTEAAAPANTFPALQPRGSGAHPRTSAAVLQPGTLAGAAAQLDLSAEGSGVGSHPRRFAADLRVHASAALFPAPTSESRLAAAAQPVPALTAPAPPPAPQDDRNSSWRRSALIWGLVFAGAAGGAALAVALNRDRLRNQTKLGAVGPGNFP